MSNDLAVAAVTEAFSLLVEGAAKGAVAGVEVKNGPPESPPANTPNRVYVYLYHVAENPHFRANDLPTRNGGGTVVTRPRIGLDLDYLISFYGEADKLEPERMLGAVVSTIHARPLLSPLVIEKAVELAVGTALEESDLAQQVEGVRVTPIDLDLEEMSKLWSIFFQEPYRLSVAYRVSVVLIEVDETPQKGLPVQVREVRSVPAVAPFIIGLSPAAVAYSQAGALLTLHGTSLAADKVVVNLGGVMATPQSVTNARIVVPVPETLPAGMQAVHVAHMIEWGTPDDPDPRPVMESNRVGFAFQPEIASAPGNVAPPGPLVLRVNPEVQEGQNVRLLLRETADSADDAPPQSFETELIATTTSHDLSFDMTGAPSGEFWLRIAVDDVVSALDFDESGFIGPKLVVT